MPVRPALTIAQRLVGLIVLLTVLLVGALAWYFTSRQLDELTRDLHGKAAAYSQVVARQSMSAVAFSDRETAREVLTSIAGDGIVDSVTLYGADGERLFSYGTPGPWVADAARATTAREIDTAHRVATVTPVVSLEGPRGALVLELSKRRVIDARARLVRSAVVTGLAALLLAAVMAWLIVRGVARRLRAIADVATAVAGGDLSQRPVADPRRDEIGTLASAFNAMLAQIKQLIDHVRDLARKEQDRLETLVAERTAALDARNGEMRTVFDHVDQGLLVVDLDGTIAREHSGAVERWLGPIPASWSLIDLVAGFAPARADWFATMWATLAEDILPFELCLAQIPDRFEVGGRHLAWSYKPFAVAGGATRILIVIDDVTAEVERRRSERDERETTGLLSRLLRDRVGAAASYAEAARLVAEVAADATADAAAYLRAVHTLKGLAGMLDLGSLAEPCHALETARAEGDVDAELAQRVIIAERWQFLADKLGPALASAAGQLDVRDPDLTALEDAIAAGAPHRELARTVAGWRDERATVRLARCGEPVGALASRLGKGPVTVAVEADPDLRLPASWAPLWSAFGHVVRNAVDHGLEPADEREAAGKPATATVTLRAHRDRDALTVEVADDGRGIDWEQVRARAAAHGLRCASHDDLVAALFHDGLSTRAEVSETSGRGVGMAAVRAACVETGGTIAIESSIGVGTRLRFTWPAPGRVSSRPMLVVHSR